ncbi:MAG: biotin--[acetyl-CoA-carboxylase] ligase [Lautropia sp.]|nr:biotin--[acetyl-CoA-carboxylase] ligase [Lautropia sp.]
MSDGTAQERLLIEHVEEVDSTNSELLRREPLIPAGSGAEALWLVARHQTGGRGRRQRPWQSTAGASLTGSFARDVRLAASSNPAALSLVAGVAVAQSLAACGLQVLLKWPNDIHVAGGKAGGILCEARARGEVTRLVIGCGLNLLAPAPGRIDQPAAGLFETANLPDRVELAAAIGRSLLAAVGRWQVDGLGPFQAQWRARDMLFGQPIVIHHYAGDQEAVARGIDADGALLAEMQDGPDRLVRVLSDEVSIRKRR